MYADPLGQLEKRLEQIDSTGWPPMKDFVAALDSARQTRNDVMHAMLVRDGLLRRSAKYGYDRDFYTVQSLVQANEAVRLASRLGNGVLDSRASGDLKSWRQYENSPSPSVTSTSVYRRDGNRPLGAAASNDRGSGG